MRSTKLPYLSAVLLPALTLSLLGCEVSGQMTSAPRSAADEVAAQVTDVAGADAGREPAAASASASAAWPTYGGDLANTRHSRSEQAISPVNVQTLTTAWKVSGPAVTSTPAIVDGIAYFGNWQGQLVAVNAKTGASVWSTQVLPAGAVSQINSSPFVTDDTVYVTGANAVVAAVERATGKIRWKETVDTQRSLMLWGSPIVVDGVLIVGIGSFQVFLPATPAFRGNVVGIDAATGKLRWRRYLTEGSGISVWATAAVDPARKVAYLGTGQEYADGPSSPNSDALIALNYETGALVWSCQFTKGDRFQLGRAFGPDHDVGATPNLFEVGGRALVGVGDKAGRYVVVDRDTGAEVWRRKLTTGGANGGVMASAAYADGVLYVVSNDGTSGGLAGTGGGPGRATLFALRASDGTPVWQLNTTPGTFGALSVANGIVYVPTLAGQLRGYDVKSGKLLWSGNLGASMGGGISIADGMVYAGYGWTWAAAAQGGIMAFKLP